MQRAWLSLGANIGTPEVQLAAAIAALNVHPAISVCKTSKTLITAAWGKTDQPDFHNLALEIETDLTPQELLAAILAIEVKLGRVRKEVWGPRVIDIDIIAFEQLVLVSDELTIPHKHAHERDFVLDPLKEIAPSIVEWIITQAR